MVSAGDLPPELERLDGAFAAIEQDAHDLVDGLHDAEGTWRTAPGTWSIAECLDHLAAGNRTYVAAMAPAAAQAQAAGRLRRRAAVPGVVGGWFARQLDAPVRRKMQAPRTIVPRVSPPLGDAAPAFFASHAQVRAFLREYAGIDLAAVRFRNPFISVIRFSLATGLHVLAAHERRHLWQARNVRAAAATAGVHR